MSITASPLVKRLLWIFGVLAVVISVQPWVFPLRGEVWGISYSIRSLGNGLGPVLEGWGLALMVSHRFRQWNRRAGEELDRMNPSGAFWFVFFTILFYVIGVASHKLRAQYSIGTHAQDLGIFSNICWNTAHGNWFYSSYMERNFMSIHVNWILWPLSLFYKAGGGDGVLLLSMPILVGLALPFLWSAVREITGSFSIGFLFSIMFVCSPSIGQHVSNDFHPDVWQIPCLMASLWAWRRGYRWRVFVFAALALLAKEDVAFVLSGYAAILFLDRRMRGVAVGLLGLSMGTLLFNILVFIPHFLEGTKKSALFDRYPFLGTNFLDMARNLVVEPSRYIRAFFYEPSKFWRLLCLSFPAGALVFLAPKFLIPAMVSVLPHIFAQAQTQLNLADIYAIPTQPFVFVGSALGLVKILQSKRLKGRAIHLAGMAFFIAGWGILASPRYYHNIRLSKIAAFQELKKLVPPSVSVAAQQNLFPHFDNRRIIQFFPMALYPLQTKAIVNPEYVAADREGNSLPAGKERVLHDIRRLEHDERYRKIFDREELVLFRRETHEPLEWLQ